MGEITVACFSAFLAFVVHLIIWKIRLPRKQTQSLLLIFFGVLCVTLALLPNLAELIPFTGLKLPVPITTYLHITLFMTSVTLAYITTYSAVEVDSPSLLMVQAIERAGEAGLSIEELRATMNNALLVEPRIRDLIHDGMAQLDGDLYRLTAKGAIMARMFTVQRRLLKAGTGG